MDLRTRPLRAHFWSVPQLNKHWRLASGGGPTGRGQMWGRLVTGSEVNRLSAGCHPEPPPPPPLRPLVVIKARSSRLSFSLQDQSSISATRLPQSSWFQMCDVMALILIVPLGLSSGPDFAGGGPGANIEDGSSLIIHWSSGSHKRSTNWANQYDTYFGGVPTGGGPGAMPPMDPINPALLVIIM